MNGAEIVAEILKREGTEFLSCYPRNPLIEVLRREILLLTLPTACKSSEPFTQERKCPFLPGSSHGLRLQTLRTGHHFLFQWPQDAIH